MIKHILPMRDLEPHYYVYFVDGNKMKGLMKFKEKREMNSWIAVHGKDCKYLHVISGFTLEERKQK